MRDIELVLLLLVLVTALTIIARRLTVPYPIVMVLGGLVLSAIPGLPEFELPPDLVFFVFLPPLLFAGGYFTSLREFKANLRPIVTLAFGLVIFTAAVVAVVAYKIVRPAGTMPQLSETFAITAGGGALSPSMTRVACG